MSLKVIQKEYLIWKEWERLQENDVNEDDVRYRLIQDGENYWLYAPNLPQPAERIFYCTPGDRAGFGGSKLTFTLEDGSTFEWAGPWASNTGALFSRTGVDLRNWHITWGVIAKTAESGLMEAPDGHTYTMDKFIDIVHIDKEPVKGNYDRIQQLAYKMALESNERLIFWQYAKGGSCRGHAIPEDLKYTDKDPSEGACDQASSGQDHIIRS